MKDTKGFTRRIVCSFDIYITVSFEAHKITDIFFKIGKQGSTLTGVLDALAMTMTLAVRSGVPWEELSSRYKQFRFEPLNDDKSILHHIALAIDDLCRLEK